MFCSLCDGFIWREGGTANGRRVCNDCTVTLVRTANMSDAKATSLISDEAMDEMCESIINDLTFDLRTTVQTAVENALEVVERKNKRAKVSTATQ